MEDTSQTVIHNLWEFGGAFGGAFGGLTRATESRARVIETGPVSFEASLLVATEGSCFNDGKFKICSLDHR